MGVGFTLNRVSEGTGGRAAEVSAAGRLESLVDLHYAFIWRSLRRLGIPRGDVDDAVQKVFLTASRKLASVRIGSEKSFLFQTALRVASDARRTVRRRREVSADPAQEPESPLPDAERVLELRRARETLDAILDAMPMDLRAVFVLFELDEMPIADIAALLGIPEGTASSRLRRARAEFNSQVQRWQQSQRADRARGGTP